MQARPGSATQDSVVLLLVHSIIQDKSAYGIVFVGQNVQTNAVVRCSMMCDQIDTSTLLKSALQTQKPIRVHIECMQQHTMAVRPATNKCVRSRLYHRAEA